ncbi:hypothetical protein NKI59_30850 [Mesorhizobium sp. M0598]|uniref:hypothetical protein n=1 Tax=Mesorhizobium sp. M0598 TaxID=2956968 RepID=UPI003334AC30
MPSPKLNLEPAVVDFLERMAAVLFPLQSWIDQKAYTPPGKYPWRDGKPIAPRELGIIAFIEGLFASAPAEIHLLERFNKAAADPLTFCPIGDMQRWRAVRGLSSKPRFGIVESGNLPLVDGKPVVRETLYHDYFPVLLQALADAQAAPSFSWEGFVDDLSKDQSAFWPVGAPKSSAFVWQFAKDCLRAMLSMRNPVDPPEQIALLIELGEHRRVGNAYGPQDARKDVEDFMKRYQEVANMPVPEGEGIVAAVHPPVGSPPITKRDLAYG